MQKGEEMFKVETILWHLYVVCYPEILFEKGG